MMAWMSKRHGLPRAGGWLDQDAGDLERMDIAADAYQAYYEFKYMPAGSGANWQLANPGKWEIVQDILGLNDG